MNTTGHNVTPYVDSPTATWIDFYAVLNVPAVADEATLRKRIGALCAQATANWEHPDPAQQKHYRRIIEQVLPQCRRVLLNREWRDKYNEVNALHRCGDATAMDYPTFLAAMNSYTQRFVVSEVQAAPPVAHHQWITPGVSALSARSVNLMTGIVTVMLMTTIQVFSAAPV